jgi:hypothetical protein
MVLKVGHFRRQIRNAWKVLKCGTGEGWRRSVGPIVYEIKKKLHRVKRRGISCIQ